MNMKLVYNITVSMCDTMMDFCAVAIEVCNMTLFDVVLIGVL